MNKLLIDIGNSTVVIVLAGADGEIKDTWRIKTQKEETISFYRHELRDALRSLSLLRIDGTVEPLHSITISSVVPEVNDKVYQAIRDITGLRPHYFSLDDALRVIRLQVEAPSGLGKDRIADAIGARYCYGAPAIVIDMGTATTVGVVDEAGDFIGGMIIPGVKTSLKALSSKASQLPMVSIEKPRNMIGRNTLECMQSGIVHGTAAMVDGIISQISATLRTTPHLVATGGMAYNIIPHCQHDIVIDPYLQFKGIHKATAECE